MLGNTSLSWQAPAWATVTSEDIEEVDEPPELINQPSSPQRFRRTQIVRPAEKTSLLTKALMGEPDDDTRDDSHSHPSDLNRRRSMASNVSIASTADLTSDTGFTSPARTNSPSPPVPELLISRLNRLGLAGKPPAPLDSATEYRGRAEAIPTAGKPNTEAPRKRCIQFACGAKPSNNGHLSTISTPVKASSFHETAAPRKTCIKFAACPSRPVAAMNTPPQQHGPANSKHHRSPSTPKRSPSTPRQTSFRKPGELSSSRPKYLRANSNDMVNDGSQFHEFARGNSREDDWIRHDNPAIKNKLTINDTLVKENQIRRLATEAEEEAELEEDEEEAAIDEEEDDEDDEDNEDDGEDDEDEDEDDEDEDEDEDEDVDYKTSDGYRTDEETGFAESESEAEAGDMAFWTLSKSPAVLSAPSMSRRSSIQGHSDSSTTPGNSSRRTRTKRIKAQADAPDLPDSTDFVCGTLDEDRPLEEAYLSCMAARRNGKLKIIPQDIDPSFPASEPEDEDEEDIYNPVHHNSDDEMGFAGRMEDLHHGQERRRRKSELYHSPKPKRHHSPPPKRCHSPAPKARGRSPKPLFDHHSPRRLRSPAPRAVATPRGSPRQGNHVKFHLAARPGPSITKSLPRPGIFTRKNDRHYRGNYDGDLPVRGAIDIVKGLEKKRQRRKEKFYQKYCKRARRGQIPERKPQPGRGALRMRELGLLMAGKKDQGNYVLSV